LVLGEQPGGEEMQTEVREQEREGPYIMPG